MNLRRDPRAIDYCGYMIVKPEGDYVVAGGEPYPYSLSINEVEEWLTADEEEAEKR